MKLYFTLLVLLFSVHIFADDLDSGKVLHSTAITLSLTVVNSTCQKSNGKILIQVSGGVAPYQYENVTRGIILQNPIDYNLLAGTYTIKVTDAIGQVATQNATITNLYAEPQAHMISKTNPSGCTSFDATLTIQGTNGVAPYTYTLDGYNFQTSNTFTNLTAGSYRYEVKDANGCLSYYIWTSNFPALIPANCTLSSIGMGGGGNCNPLFFFWTVGAPSGGTPPYIYSKDGINYQTSKDFDSISPGVFTVWIKDAAGLVSLVSSSRIDEHYNCLPFSVSTTTQAALCGQNGSITAIAKDGLPPYQYSLDGINFQTGNQFAGLAPGNYTVTVKDSLNLTSAILAFVPNNCVIVMPATTNSTCGNNNGKIISQASNGTAPYQYSLDGIIYTSNNVFTNLIAGNYTVYTKDAAAKVGTAKVIISDIPGPQIVSADTTATSCANNTGIINVIAQGGTPPLTYTINGTSFQTNPLFAGLPQGTYTVTVKDANTCTVTKPAIIAMNNNAPVVKLGNDITLCEDNTLLLDATNANATYLWQDNTTNPTYFVTTAGKYFVTVTRQGCIAKDTINITYNLKPKFSLGADSRLCMGSIITLNPQITGVSYLWQDGNTSPTYTVTQPGLYSLTATNTCGSATDNITIGNGVCNLYVPNSFTPNGDAKNDVFKASYGDNVIQFHLQIFNRYGQIIFETKDKNKGWDGTFKGSRQPYDGYVWLMQYKTATNNNLQKLQGTVLLIR
jgi:gliding motility-associated-like protein